MEARLLAALPGAEGGGDGENRGTSAEKPAEGIEDAAEATASEGATNAWTDEAAEAAFLSEARERGEPVLAAAPEVREETDSKNLPTLETLVKRIPPEVREALDDLFRAKFVAVRRVPRKALKS